MNNLSTILSVLAICGLLASACYLPIDEMKPTDFLDPPKPPPPAPATTLNQTEGYILSSGNQLPKLPETDVVAWNFLYSLISMSNMMAGEHQTLEEIDFEILEQETYPLFVQAHLNCSEGSTLKSDYESLTDLIGMLVVFGIHYYEYNSPALLQHLLENAAEEEFALSSLEIGCLKSFFLIFVDYSEVKN
ncbi:MAG: hypothetical protein OXH98_14465 [Caldilineaceae bacterium]|nr:hypothetical protein [Caldilineaceae bacterium]